MLRESSAATRARSTTRLLAESCLSTPGSRLAAAVLLAAGTLSAAFPARAGDWFINKEADLHSALANAVFGDNIQFNTNITLTANLPPASAGNLTINGQNFALSGNNQYRGLFVDGGGRPINVAINNLTITNALAQGGKGGDAQFNDCAPCQPPGAKADLYGSGGGGGGGGAGMGGALFIGKGALVTVSNVSLQDSRAQGGNGGSRLPGTSGNTSGGGGSYWPTGADGENGGSVFAGNGGTPSGGDGAPDPAAALGRETGTPGGFGGGGGGSYGGVPASGGIDTGGSAGGFGGGAGGSGGLVMNDFPLNSVAEPGGFGGGNSNANDPIAGGGGGAGFGGAIFVQEGGSLTLKSPLIISGNSVAGGEGGRAPGGAGGGNPGKGIGSGIFLHGNGSLILAPDAGQTQTINDVIIDQTGAGGSGADSGSWSLVKNGAGTTILTAANGYSGGTTITGGLINFNSSNNFGSGKIVLDGGGLQWATGTATDISSRLSAFGAGGATFDTNGNNVTLASAFSGTGGLTKTGAGVLTLAGNNTYSGGTTVSGGALQGNTSSLQGKIINNASVIFDQASNGTYAGSMSGTGALTKIGAGVLMLGSANTYSGGTTVSGGALQGNTSSLQGNIINNASVIFDQASNGTYAGSMSGTGVLTKIGAGVLMLGSANTYAGGTMVTQGTLAFAHVRPGGGGTIEFDALGSGAVNLNGGTLRNAAVGSPILHNNIVLGPDGGILDGAFGLAGTITGPGSLILQRGTSGLTGAATHTGATTLESGVTLLLLSSNALAAGTSAFRIASGASFNLLGRNATIGSLADVAGAGGTVINSGITHSVLRIGSDNTSTSFSGTLEDGDFGTLFLAKIGAGTQTLSGANTYTGATTVEGGGLIVNGSIAKSSGLTVNAGAMVGGTGTLPSTTINGGTLSPGNSIGTIAINGNLVFGAGSIYRVEASPSAADRTNVTGSATLAGTVQVIFGPGAGPTNTYTILSAAHGGSGTFDKVETNHPGLSASLSYTPNHDVLLKLSSQIGSLITGTPNQEAVAAAHDTAFNAGLPAHSALFGLSAAQIPAALHQLSGEVHTSTAGVLVDESRYVRTGVLGRLRQASYGNDAGMAALSFGGPQTAFADGELDRALAYGKTPLPVKAPLTAPTASPDIVFWAEGFGAAGRFDSDGNAATLRRDLAGFMTGLDTRIGSNGRAGIAAGYTASRNNTDGRGSANVETGHLAAYGGWSFGSFKLRGGAAFSWHTIDTDRTIAFPGFFDRATANYAGRTGQIFGEVGYGFAFGSVAVEPFAGAAWVHLDTDAAVERATVAGLNIGATSFETGYSTLGVRAASLIPIGHDMVLIPRASATWQHAFNDVTPATALAFQASGTGFVISGVPIARDALLAEAGLDLAIGRNATVGVSYVGQIAGNVQDHAAKGKFSWKF